MYYEFLGYNFDIPTRLIKEGNVLFNHKLNTFYLRLYGIRYIKDHSGSERGNLLPPLHGLLFPNSSKGSFRYTIIAFAVDKNP